MAVDTSHIPTNPGCYIFKDKLGKILYVGKAKSLSKRVRSYFHAKNHDTKTQRLVSHIASVDFLVTDSEVEALILENNLIKKNKPKYNIALKDSKRFAYIQVTDEEFPRLLVARKREGSGTFYGPFVSAAARDHVIEALRKIFKIRTCKKLPKRECMRYSIGLCSAPCTKRISGEDYNNSIASAELVLKGKTKQLAQELEKKMKEESKLQHFEAALELRNQIAAINDLQERQNMERHIDLDEDIINYIIEKEMVHILVFGVRKGILENKRDFEFNHTPNFLEEFIMQYYTEEESIPKRIITPHPIDPTLADYFKKVKGVNVKFEVPKKGEKKALLDLVKKNLEITHFGDLEKINDLAKKLELNDTPSVIECFDISHLSGTATVASMVQFRNGKPDKNNYRKFKIRDVAGIDDFAAMKEVIKRRYSKLKVEKLELPDLIVIDGGKGQLSSALEVLELLKLKIPIISLAKREEEVFVPGRSESIRLPKKSKALGLLIAIRDEAHRFAITYNRLLRKKKLFGH